MRDITIHGIDISYDDSHERVRDFVEYLKNEKMKEELKSYCRDVRDNYNSKIHISDKYDNEFTLEYEGDLKYSLRLRDL